jgi:hypothetical protein
MAMPRPDCMPLSCSLADSILLPLIKHLHEPHDHPSLLLHTNNNNNNRRGLTHDRANKSLFKALMRRLLYCIVYHQWRNFHVRSIVANNDIPSTFTCSSFSRLESL